VVTHSIEAYDQTANQNTNKDQPLLHKGYILKKQTDSLFEKIRELKTHPDCAHLLQEVNAIILLNITQDYVTNLLKMTPSEFKAFFQGLEEHVKNHAENKDGIQLFKCALEFLQKNLLPQYSIDDLFTFGILYELFEGYIQINGQIFNINTGN